MIKMMSPLRASLGAALIAGTALLAGCGGNTVTHTTTTNEVTRSTSTDKLPPNTTDNPTNTTPAQPTSP